MKVGWGSVLRWALVMPVVLASTFVVFFFSVCGISLLIEESAFEVVEWLRMATVPAAILRTVDRALFLGAMLVWVVPLALTVGFAPRARWLSRWQWGLVASLVLTSCFWWFSAWQRGDKAMLWALGVAGCILAAEVVVWIGRFLRRSVAIWGLLAASLILWAPDMYRLAAEGVAVPRPVWSVVLEKGGWELTRPGTEFEAPPAKMAIAGNRVAMFDAGLSGYRLLSLDLKTGDVRNQMEFVVPLGAEPSLFGTSDGHLLLDDGKLRLLTPDLKEVGEPLEPEKGRVVDISPDGSTLGWEVEGGVKLLDAATFQTLATLPKMELSALSPGSVSREAAVTNNLTEVRGYPGQTFVIRADAHGTRPIFHDRCGMPPHFLAEDRILLDGCGEIRILNGRGEIIAQRRDVEDAYAFAGVSRNGARFALKASEERGDSPEMIYERIYVYDTKALGPVAAIAVTVPGRRLWTAFSGDGRYFAVGDPDRMSLYEIP